MSRFNFSLVLVLGLVFGLVRQSEAQGLNSDGRDFYLGLLYPSYNAQGPLNANGNLLGFYGVYALVSSYYDKNVVTVSYFDTLTGKEFVVQSYTVMARRAVQIPLNISQMKMTEPGEMPEFRACHITAKKSINVQFFSTGSNSGGSYLALPNNVLGSAYVVESYHDNVGGVGGLLTNEDASGLFMVIAPFDNTTIAITPSSTTKRGMPGVSCGVGANGKPQPFQINLNHGQCYMVKSAAKDPSCDISGTTIISSKPIALIAGHENASTDGGDPSPGGSLQLEGRDYMVEQMFPVDFWDSTGLVSIPFVDSKPPARDGEGDEYRIYCGIIPELGLGGPKGTTVNLNLAGFGNPALTQSTGPWNIPAPGKLSVTVPVAAYSNNGVKIHLVQYDQRMQGAGAPFPAPGQMSIVPMSRWKSSYLWYVPNNTFESLQGYYINLICNRDDYNHFKIKLAFNGGKPQPIQAAGLAVKRLFATLSSLGTDYDSIMGVQFGLGPGAYYATVDTGGHPFIIYNYGFRAIDPNRDLGDFCGDDHFFQYALPVGFAARGDSGKLTITVDTLCAKWHVCVHDGRLTNPGIKSFTLLDDPNGDFTRPGRQYHNSQFDPSLDPDDTREIDLPGNDTTVCVDVLVSNPLDSAYAPVYILDNQGNDYTIDLRYRAPSLKLKVVPNWRTPVDTLYHADSIIFPRQLRGADTCAVVEYYNAGKPGDADIKLVSVKLKRGDGSFAIGTVTPPLPANIKVGDTLRVTVCFNSLDEKLHVDSLLLETSCFIAPITLVGQGGRPLILATDKDFGSVPIGVSKCDTVTVRNVGDMPFTVTDTFMHDHTNFSWNTGNLKLPFILQPGQFVRISFCFTPQDTGDLSTLEDWITNMVGPGKDSLKSWSLLKGHGIRPGVVWDRPTQLDSTVCDAPDTVKVYLLNQSTAETHVYNVLFEGLDADEYSLIDNQGGYNPLEGFNMKPNDTMWVRYQFKPNLAKGFRDRSALLVATFRQNSPSGEYVDSTVIVMTGRITYPALKTFSDTIYAGFVTLGQMVKVTQLLSLGDTGTAPYIFTAADFIPPVDSILDAVTGKRLQVGDTLFPNQIITVQITVQMTTYGDTIVKMHFGGQLCSNSKDVYVRVIASSTALQGTGWPAPDTYINCREHHSVIRASNLGFSQWELKSVTILPAPGGTGMSEFDLIDSSGKFVKVFNANVLMGPAPLPQFFQVGVSFHDTHLGPDSVRVQFVFDSAGMKQDTIFTTLTGTGIAEKTTVSAANNDPSSPIPGYYVYETAKNLAVPMRFDISTLPASANAKTVSFGVTWKRDVFQMATPGAIPPGVDFRSPYSGSYNGPMSSVNDPGRDSVFITATNNNGPIVSLDTVCNLNFQVMVNRDTTTQVIASDVKFLDDLKQPICYIATDTIPGNFISKDLCGNAELRYFLTNDQVATRIISLTPNPASQNGKPVLRYQVNQSNLPITIEVYNLLGEKVRTLVNGSIQAKGDYRIEIPTEGLESGTYSIRLAVPGRTETSQFILNK